MTERTDHVADALGWRELVNDQYESGHPDHEKVMEYGTLMQASATIALVEQQRIQNEQARITNLIAIMRLEIQEDKPIERSEATLALYEEGTLRPDIASALGIKGMQ
ncbi:hypothetical protein JD276_13145 [Leucobacter sp. CSA1]|uniref:Uncharacterized protein n=1 Tax=Leucobacter chromiisoli TaxID=2796471 RepID=A0A934QBD1_9MICO|nr:hypothetical protein [Leucobacter chromiisoli]MBK0419977.1 hypothetical protein [Leucobacter chromiisoli]